MHCRGSVYQDAFGRLLDDGGQQPNPFFSLPAQLDFRCQHGVALFQGRRLGFYLVSQHHYPGTGQQQGGGRSGQPPNQAA